MTTAVLPRPLDPQRLVQQLVLLCAIGLLTFAVVRTAPGEDCKFHGGPFDNHFSAAFDISNIACRVSEDWTIHFWGVPPYVGLEFTPSATRP